MHKLYSGVAPRGGGGDSGAQDPSLPQPPPRSGSIISSPSPLEQIRRYSLIHLLGEWEGDYRPTPLKLKARKMHDVLRVLNILYTYVLLFDST